MKKYLVLGSIISAVLLLGGAATYIALAQTSSTQVTACAKPTGDVYLIGPNFSKQNCTGQQIEISWPTLAGTPKAKKIYDGSNEYLGTFISTNQLSISGDFSYTTWYEPLKIFLNFSLDSQRHVFMSPIINIQNQFALYWENTNCSGAPYSRSFTEYGGYYPEEYHLMRIGTGLYTGTSSSEIQITSLSTETELGCQNTGPEIHMVYPLVKVVLPSSVENPVWPLQVIETQF